MKQAWKDFKDNSCFTGLKQGFLQVSELVEMEGYDGVVS